MAIAYAVTASTLALTLELATALWFDLPAADVGWNFGRSLVLVAGLGALGYGLLRWVGRRTETAELERANRLYRALAKVNEVALGAADRAELGREICRALVEQAGLRLAWVGWVEESDRSIRVEASAGAATAYVAGLNLSVEAGHPASLGPAGQCLLRGSGIACPSIANEPSMALWREQAERHGLRSCALAPLLTRDGARGVLALYSAEEGFFTPEIVVLADKLAADVVRGVEFVAMQRREEAQAQELRASEQRWQFALEGAGDGVWDLDVAGGGIFVSRRLAEMFGYAPEEFADGVRDWASHVHPDDRAEAEARFADYLASRTPVFLSELRVRHRDGGYRWVLNRGKVVARDQAGQPLRLIGTLADISEIRRADERMAMLYAALQAVPAGIVIAGRDGRIEWVNDAFERITGFVAAEVIGETPHSLNAGRLPVVSYEEITRTALCGRIWNGEFVNRRKSGEEYHERMLVAAVKGRDGEASHFVAVRQDITEEKRMERQMLRSQRMESVGLLAGGIAHDLNNVLAPILISAELLRERCTDPDIRRTLEVIETSARRGSGVVRQVLTFAQGVEGNRALLRPGDLVREVMSIVRETFPRNLVVQREGLAETAAVLGDPTQLHQVLLNLAVNARDAMPDGGTLSFGLRETIVADLPGGHPEAVKPGSYVELMVSDTGVGISADVKERIFDPFFTTKPRGKGSGLGLPTALGIVRSHGGHIEVVSAPGAGSRFLVRLPVVAAAREEIAVSSRAPELRGGGRTVLVCDDEAAIRDIAEIVLRQAGFEVLHAENGRDAVRIWRERGERISAVVMDVMMPSMTGDQAAVEMLRQGPDRPILFMSGLLEQEALAAALRNFGPRPVELLRKPFEVSDLLERLARVLGPADMSIN